MVNTKIRAVIAGAALSAASLSVVSVEAHAAPLSDWERLAQCESGGNWKINTGNGYHGGLQFHPQTWLSHGGGEFAATADQASKEEQIFVAEKVLASQGWGAWPACSASLGLSSDPEQRNHPRDIHGDDAPAVEPERSEVVAPPVGESTPKLDAWAKYAISSARNLGIPEEAIAPAVRFVGAL